MYRGGPCETGRSTWRRGAPVAVGMAASQSTLATVTMPTRSVWDVFAVATVEDSSSQNFRHPALPVSDWPS